MARPSPRPGTGQWLWGAHSEELCGICEEETARNTLHGCADSRVPAPFGKMNTTRNLRAKTGGSNSSDTVLTLFWTLKLRLCITQLEPGCRKLLRGILGLSGRASERKGDVLSTRGFQGLGLGRLERNCPMLLQDTFPQQLEPRLTCTHFSKRGGGGA